MLHPCIKQNMFKSKQAEDFWQKLEKKQLNDDVNFSKVSNRNLNSLLSVIRKNYLILALQSRKNIIKNLSLTFCESTMLSVA